MFPYSELFDALQSDIAGHCGERILGIPSYDDAVDVVRCRSLLGSFYKKLSPLGLNVSADAAALEKFLGLNAAISTRPFEYPEESEQDSIFWDYFRDNFLKCLTPSDVSFDLAFMRETFAAGPGASLGCDNDSFYTKLFASKISSTSDYLLSLFRGAICESDTWSEAERLRHHKFGVQIVSGNRLFFVPKTAEISRTCCTEPLVNMLIQKALGAFLELCLQKSFGISLKTQPTHNRELARVGSSDQSFGTIDLQSASDSISWPLVQRICPGNLLGFFRQARCESTSLPDGTQIGLNMISTMGNGFTFPLQTIIFACTVRSVYQMMNLDSHCPRTQFGVFGDDIIVRRDAYHFVVTCLTKLGFKVNDTKSFNTGPFRESCGYDWHAGAFVRGVYIRSLETVFDVYSAINRLNRWSALSGVRLQSTIALLRAWVRKPCLVPFSEDVDCGIQTPFKMTVPRVDNGYWFRYRKIVRQAKRQQVPESKEESHALKYSFYNEYGWAVTRLGGFARSEDPAYKIEGLIPLEEFRLFSPRAFLTPREKDGQFRTKVISKSIPCWDWPGSGDREYRHSWEHEALIDDPFRFFSYASWERSVAGNC